MIELLKTKEGHVN